MHSRTFFIQSSQERQPIEEKHIVTFIILYFEAFGKTHEILKVIKHLANYTVNYITYFFQISHNIHLLINYTRKVGPYHEQ